MGTEVWECAARETRTCCDGPSGAVYRWDAPFVGRRGGLRRFLGIDDRPADAGISDWHVVCQARPSRRESKSQPASEGRALLGLSRARETASRRYRSEAPEEEAT